MKPQTAGHYRKKSLLIAAKIITGYLRIIKDDEIKAALSEAVLLLAETGKAKGDKLTVLLNEED